MTIQDKDKIDFVGISEEDNSVFLFIYDHFEWSKGEKEDLKHLLLLQEKINLYLGYCEGGQLLEDFPKAKDRNIVINVQLLYRPDQKGNAFLSKAKELVNEGGFELEYVYVGDNPKFKELKEDSF